MVSRKEQKRITLHSSYVCTHLLFYIKQNLLEADRPLSFSDALDGEAERHVRTALHPDAREAGLVL